MLDELDTIINSGQSVIVFTILSDPGGVLIISGGLFSCIESFISFNILDSFSKVLFGLVKSSNSVVSQFSVGTLLGNMVVDVSIQIKSDLI